MYKFKLNKHLHMCLCYIPLGGPAWLCETIHAKRLKHVYSQEESLRSDK